MALFLNPNSLVLVQLSDHKCDWIVFRILCPLAWINILCYVQSCPCLVTHVCVHWGCKERGLWFPSTTTYRRLTRSWTWPNYYKEYNELKSGHIQSRLTSCPFPLPFPSRRLWRYYSGPPYIAPAAWALFRLFTQLPPENTLLLVLTSSLSALARDARSQPDQRTVQPFTFSYAHSPHGLYAPLGLGAPSLSESPQESHDEVPLLQLPPVLWMWLATHTLTSICLLFMYLCTTKKGLGR